MTANKNPISQDDDIAIIGMACTFPKAADLPGFWRNIVNKVDAVSDVPDDRWDVAVFYDPQCRDGSRLYGKRGAYLESPYSFDPTKFRVMPVAVEGGEPDQFLVLKTATDAMADAGRLNLAAPETNVEFILGRGNFVGSGSMNLVQKTVVLDQTLAIVRKIAPHFTGEDLDSLRKELASGLHPFGPETATAVMPSISASRVANRLGFNGPTYTLDAACASSLLAVEAGVKDLKAGLCELAIAGGVHIFNTVPFLSVFCALGAFSQEDVIRPFDRRADGVIPGEGVGLVVLKRKAEAERDGDRIYAIVKGISSASDGKTASLNSPSAVGECLAMSKAQALGGVTPDTIGLIEAHGTATPVGDAVEIQALKAVFGERKEGQARSCALGSVKSMIGHTMPAAGIAALIKTALALHYKVLPPTLHCEEPNPKFELEKTPFYINTETRPWIHGRPDSPRRAGINAFGFGGINAHAVLEEYPTDSDSQNPVPVPWDTEVFLFSGSSTEELLAGLEKTRGQLDGDSGEGLAALSRALWGNLGGSSHRLAIVAASREDLREKLEYAINKIGVPSCKKIQDIRGIYYFSSPLGREGKIAFLFPGEGSAYSNMMMDLCLHFPEVRACFDDIDRVVAGREKPCRFLPSQFIFPAPSLTDEEYRELEMQFWEVDSGLQSILAANFAAEKLLRKLSVYPDMIVGHSAGEYSAWISSGIISAEDLFAKQEALSSLYREGEKQAKTALFAVSTNREKVEALLREVGGEIYVSNDNCPHQVLVVGTSEGIEKLSEAVKAKGIMGERLPSSQAHHTPFSSPHTKHLRRIFSSMKPSAPKTKILSPTIMAPYPDKPGEILSLMVDYWVKPLEFRKTIEAMYAGGARIFIETGAGTNLVGFVDDTLRGKPHIAVSVNNRRKSGIEQLCHLIGVLAAHHVPLTLDPFFQARGRDCEVALVSGEAKKKSGGREILLPLGLPQLKLRDSYVPRKPPAEPEAAVQPSLKPAPMVGTGQADRSSPTVADRPMGREHKQSVRNADRGGVSSSAMRGYLDNMNRFLDVQQDVMNSYLSRRGTGHGGVKVSGQAVRKLPFVGEVLSLEPGKRCSVRRRIDLREDVFLYDHPFGFDISETNRQLYPLIVVPLTIGAEVMAEAASLLFPGQVPVCIRDIRANQWIEVEEDAPTTLTVDATMPTADSKEARVRILVGEHQVVSGAAPGRAPAMQATVVFAENYSTGDEVLRGVRPEDFSLPPGRGSDASVLRTPSPGSHSGQEVYQGKYMPHGRRFQVLVSLDEMTESTLCSHVRVPGEHDLFSSNPEPRMLLSPILLDACAQSLGYWAQKCLRDGFITFPIGAREIRLLGSPPGANDRLECRMRVRKIDESLVSADLEMVGSDGRTCIRVLGWTHRRFILPLELYDFWKSPAKKILGRECSTEESGLVEADKVSCVCMGHYPEVDHTIWKKATAYLYLNSNERKTYREKMSRAAAEGNHWLAGRMAGKDAVRGLVQRKLGIDCYPADIEIEGDMNGNPSVEGRRIGDRGETYQLCIRHADGLAVAVAANADPMERLTGEIRAIADSVLAVCCRERS